MVAGAACAPSRVPDPREAAKASLWRDEYDLDVVIAKAEVGA